MAGTNSGIVALAMIVTLAGCVTTGSDEVRRSAWRYYGASEAIWIADRGVADSFEREVHLRGELAKGWAVQKKRNKDASDRDLDQLAAVVHAGLLKEYVWTHLARPEWKKPEGLDLPRFDAWRKENLKDHDAKEPRQLFVAGNGR